VSNFLAGRKILFVGIGFYDYESSIKAYLEECGAVVSYHLQCPRWHQVAFFRRIAQFFGVSTEQSVSGYQSRLLEGFNNTQFDDVFVIKGDALRDDFMVGLRQRNPGARFIQYHWDSVKRVPNAMQMAAHFDRVYSFDRFDCEANAKFRFRPLFYRGDQIARRNEAKVKYDLLFVGWLHADRLARIMELEKLLKFGGKRTYFFLFTGLRTYLNAWFKGAASNLSIRKMPYADVEALMLSAKCILDISHPDQTGLTIRTIETLGKNRKLVTTNADILNYDFFNPSNILLSPMLDVEEILRFLEKPFEPVPASLVEKYSIGSWINEIFS
jgi:hypothetical protein